jgi:hypothetical protein
MPSESDKRIIENLESQLCKNIWPLTYPSEIGLSYPPEDQAIDFFLLVVGPPVSIQTNPDGTTTFTYQLPDRTIYRTVTGNDPTAPASISMTYHDSTG